MDKTLQLNYFTMESYLDSFDQSLLTICSYSNNIYKFWLQFYQCREEVVIRLKCLFCMNKNGTKESWWIMSDFINNMRIDVSSHCHINISQD